MAETTTPSAVSAAHVARDKTADVGTIVFLGSWAMMFMALFFCYATLRFQSVAWPPPGQKLPLLLPTLSTVFIAGSSVTLHRGLALLQRDRPERFLRWLLDTIALGGLFMALQWVTWTSLHAGGLVPSSGLLAGMFYLLTIFHAAHVVVGITILLTLLPRAWRYGFSSADMGTPRRAAMFWDFVGVAWLVIYLGVFAL